MVVCIGDNKLLVTTESKNFYFDLYKDVNNNLKHKMYYVIKHSEHLADHTIKNKIRQFCPNISIKTTLMNTKNSKMN